MANGRILKAVLTVVSSFTIGVNASGKDYSEQFAAAEAARDESPATDVIWGIVWISEQNDRDHGMDLERERKRMKHLSYGIKVLERAYDVPINFETNPTYFDDGEYKFYTEFAVTKGEPLRDALDRFVAQSRGLYEWKPIEGQVCVYPALDGENPYSLLGERVSINVQNVSAWTAVSTLLETLNREHPRKSLYVSLTLMNASIPLPGFREDKVVTIQEKDAVARDVLCNIFRQSSLPIFYKVFGGATLQIYFVGQSNGSVRHTREDTLFWQDEQKRMHSFVKEHYSPTP
jgi:hypothetical protein